MRVALRDTKTGANNNINLRTYRYVRYAAVDEGGNGIKIKKRLRVDQDFRLSYVGETRVYVRNAAVSQWL